MAGVLFEDIFDVKGTENPATQERNVLNQVHESCVGGYYVRIKLLSN
jgi:hypothetical protein